MAYSTFTLTGTFKTTAGVAESVTVTVIPSVALLVDGATGGAILDGIVAQTFSNGVVSIANLPTLGGDILPASGWGYTIQVNTASGQQQTRTITTPPAAGSLLDIKTLTSTPAPVPMTDTAVGTSALDSLIAAKVNDSASLTRAALSDTYAAMAKLPTGVAATDTANIQAAITSALAFGITKVQLQAGAYRTNAALTVGDNLIIEGAGREATTIRNAVSDVFSWSGTGSKIRDLAVYSEAGGGHIFKQVALVKRCEFLNLHLDQANDAKSIYSHAADLGNYLFNKWSHVTPRHTNTATVPTFHFVALTSAGAVNANTWEDMDPTRSGAYSFHLESARSGNYVYDNVLRDIRYEQPDGGCVKLLGTNRTVLESHTIYDYSAPAREPFYVGRGTHATVPVGNRNLIIRNLMFTAAPGAYSHIKFQAIDGGVAPAENTVLDSCMAYLGDITVDFGGNSKIALINSQVTRVNGDRAVAYTQTGEQLAPAAYLSGKNGTTGLAVDAVGGAQTYGPHDVGLGAQQLLNSEFDTDIRQWTDGGTVLSYATNKMRLNNTSGGYINVTGTCAANLTGGTTHKIVLKLASVTSFPAPTTSLRLYDGTTYQTITNTTSEQTFYQALGSGGVVLRTGDGLDVELDYIRVYPVTSAQLFAHGPLAHRGTTLGFYGVTPASRPAAYTQTYSTASRAHAAYTADAESAAYTGAGDGEAKLADLNALRVAYENLRAHHESTAAVLNQLLDDLQANGLLQ